MKKLLLLICVGIFAVSLCSCQEEAQLDESDATTAVALECPKDCTCPTCQKKADCPKDCDKPCCAKDKVCDKKDACSKDCSKCPKKETCTKTCNTKDAKSACPKDCDKPCCKKDDAAKAACPKDCAKACCNTVVTVNGQAVTEKEVSAEVAKRLEGQKKRMPPGMEMPETMMQQMRTRVVDMKIEQVLLDQEIAKQNVSVSDDQVIEEIKKIAGQKGQTMEEVEKEVANYGMTLEDLKAQIRMQIQVKALMEAKTPDAEVTEADVKKFYDENPQHFNQPEQVQASHILCGKRGITEDEYPAELEKIEKAKARLDAGEAFEEVAKDVSTCPSSAKGGDLGFFGKGQMDPAFEKAAFGLEVGQTTDVVKTSFGYHIIKLTDKKEGGVTSLEEAKEKITQFLTGQKQQGFWSEYSKTMREDATIEYSAKEQAARDEMEKAAAEAAAARAARQAAPKPIQPTPAPKPETTEEK